MDAIGPPHVELLYWAGCPSHDRAARMLKSALSACGLDPALVVVRQILTLEEARREGFVGSPTIRINARDILPTDEEPALTCRIYHCRDGRVSALPDQKDLKDALQQALEEAARRPA